ncbi:DUF2269 family protein [Candidatus Foliamicus sp.]
MTLHLFIKLIHVVSSTLILGTGIGTAFFMLTAYRSGDMAAIRVTSRHVVLADWIFTTPAVVLQLATGLWLTSYLGISYSSAWFLASLAMFVLVGACWLPVVWIQIRLRQMIDAHSGDALPKRFSTLMRIWIALGVPAFLLTLTLFWLMVFKPGLNWILFQTH